MGRLTKVFYGCESAGISQPHCYPDLAQALFLGEAEGEAGWNTDGHDFVVPFTGPHMWIVPPGVPHWIRLRSATKVIVVYAKLRFLAEVTEGVSLNTDLFPLERCLAEDRSIADLIATFGDPRRGTRPTGPNLVDVTGALLALRLIAAYLQPGRRENKTGSGLSEASLNHFVAYIRSHIGDRLTRAALARQAGISPWHFARLFKMSTGKSPARYIRELRLDIAKDRLLDGQISVTALAHELGFCDHNQLAYNFKKRFGVTPRALLGQR